MTMAADLMAGEAGGLKVGRGGIELPSQAGQFIASSGAGRGLSQQILHCWHRFGLAQVGHQSIADQVPAGGKPLVGQGFEGLGPFGSKGVPVKAVLPDKSVGIDECGGLKKHAANIEPLEHASSTGVHVAQTIIEADNHTELIATRKGTLEKIREGEEVSPLHLQEAEFIQQGCRWDRRYTKTVEKRDSAGMVNPVIQQAENLAIQPPPPIGIEGG